VKKKSRTRDQVATAKKRAVTFERSVLHDQDRADEIEAESLESYAQRRGIPIIDNPSRQAKEKRKKIDMPGSSTTKTDLENSLDQICVIAEDALSPTSTRKQLAEALQSIYEICSPDDEEDDNSDDEDDEDE